MDRTSKTAKVALIVALALLTAACLAAVAQALAADSSASPAPSPGAGKVVLSVGWTVSPDNLNPYIGYELSSWEVWSLEYDFLFNPYPGGTYGPQLAAEIPTTANGGISADGKVYTVHIRSGVKWQDGQPLTAQDVAFSYNYVIDTPMYNWNMMTTGIKKAVAVNPTTVKFYCSQPEADFLKSPILIVPEHIWGKVKGSVAQRSYQNMPPIVGSGPFQVVGFKKDGYVKLERNPLYWGPQPTVDEIYFLAYQNADTMVEELKNGTIDAADGLLQAQFGLLGADKRFRSVAYNLYQWDYLAFNCYTGQSLGNPALRDPAFRRALATAIDNAKLVAIAYNGHAAPGTTMINPDTWTNPDWHWEPPAGVKYTFDLAKAGQMLDAAGYPLKNGVRVDKTGKPITLRLWAEADQQPTQIEGKLITGWWKQIGINVQLDVMDPGTIDDHIWNYRGNTYVPDYDCYLYSTSGFVDPGQTLSMLTTGQIQNWNDACWSNPQFDKLAQEQAVELDSGKRLQMIDQMQQIMYEDAPLLVLLYPQNLQAYNTRKWTDWTPLMIGGKPGPVVATSSNRETYLNLKPAAHSGKSSITPWISAIIAAVVVAVAVVVWIVVRRRRGPQEEVAQT